jgi:hypothetical protein
VILKDGDDNRYIDFCLGDTGAMFGHSPKPIVEALQREAATGFTTMMPSIDAVPVGQLLERPFRPAVLAGDCHGIGCQSRRHQVVPRHHRPQEDPGLQSLLSWRRR